jgi:hypothetical protein
VKKLISAAAIVVLALSGIALGDSQDSDGKKIRKDPLPRESTVQWDVTFFEDSPGFAVVKREVKGNTVTWVLENKRMLGTEIIFGYQAAFYDEDGVKLGVLQIEVDPFLMNTAKGERNRFNLHLPQPDKWKGARKVVIKNGQN